MQVKIMQLKNRSFCEKILASAFAAVLVLIPDSSLKISFAENSQTKTPHVPNLTNVPNVSNLSSLVTATSPAKSGSSTTDAAPPAEPPEKSTDKGFSTADFLHEGEIKQSKLLPKAAEPPAAVNLIVRVTVPHYTDAVDQFVAYPYPMPVPTPRRPPGTKNKSTVDSSKKKDVPTQAYDPMPSTRKAIRDLIFQTGYTARTKRNVAYPQGGWRWQMAYRNALQKCKLGEPNIITEMYPFVNAMEPLARAECKHFDELEEERQRRYEAAFEEFQLNRNDIEFEAVQKGYFPVEFQLNKLWRGKRAKAELRLGPGKWWITGTHKVAGLLYYWQQPVQITANQTEELELNWQNALVIEGGW
jgi:hypothetical protein